MLLPLCECTMVVRGTARKLNLGGERAALEFLVAVEVEQRILAVQPVKFLGHEVDDDIVPNPCRPAGGRRWWRAS